LLSEKCSLTHQTYAASAFLFAPWWQLNGTEHKVYNGRAAALAINFEFLEMLFRKGVDVSH
jgi:hypothetical protein